jgi:alpha-L-fucosidase 2
MASKSHARFQVLYLRRWAYLYAGIALCAMSPPLAKGAEGPEPALNWNRFLEVQSPVWNALPQNWTEAPFLGNGMLGIQLYQIDEQTLQVDVGRGDAQEHRLPVKGRMNDRCRLPVGRFLLHTAGRLRGCSLRLSLYDATLEGILHTDRGPVSLKAYVHAEAMAILIESRPEGPANSIHWEWRPLPAINPRWTNKPDRMNKATALNPDPVLEQIGEVSVCIQGLLAGGETATAWQVVAEPTGNSTLIASVAHSHPYSEARHTAVDDVLMAAATRPDVLYATHLNWWHAYYPKSFVSLPDPYWESFYWMQMYKLASATRGNGMLLDNQGPWLQPTIWPGAWWNLNVQLSYWPLYASNRHSLAESLVHALRTNRAALIHAVPETYRHDSAALGRETGQHLWGQTITEPGTEQAETGHLPWALHNVWLHYRHTLDESMLREVIYPLLRRAINYYLHFLQPDAQGVLHLPATWSPEYRDIGPDCSYDLALIRWGCQTLIESNSLLGMRDPLLATWNDTLQRLAQIPTDETGILIAKGVPLTYGHRHYSHLLALYPLYLINRDMEGAEALMRTSLEHWLGLEQVGNGRFTVYSLTGAASIAAAFGDGNGAISHLNRIRPRLFPNTLYGEASPLVPVIESPLSAAQTLHDMLIQSWGDKIRVFPAMPAEWKEAVFDSLSAEGGYLISARREKGLTRWVRVRSLSGNPVTLIPGFASPAQTDASMADRLQQEAGSDACILHLNAGEEIILWSGERPASFETAPVSGIHPSGSPFGLP